MTAKSKTRAKQSALVAAAAVTIAGAGWKIDIANIPGCNANAMNPTDYVLVKTFDTYCANHEKYGEEVIKRIDGRLGSIERNLDMLVNRLIPPASRRTDASEFSFEASSTVFCNPF